MPACAPNLKTESETTTFSPVKRIVKVIFPTNICVLFIPQSGLLYACETWKTTNQIKRRLQIFVNKYLRRIMNIKWTNKTTKNYGESPNRSQ
jgi:hypothetical protein